MWKIFVLLLIQLAHPESYSAATSSTIELSRKTFATWRLLEDELMSGLTLGDGQSCSYFRHLAECTREDLRKIRPELFPMPSLENPNFRNKKFNVPPFAILASQMQAWLTTNARNHLDELATIESSLHLEQLPSKKLVALRQKIARMHAELYVHFGKLHALATLLYAENRGKKKKVKEANKNNFDQVMKSYIEIRDEFLPIKRKILATIEKHSSAEPMERKIVQQALSPFLPVSSLVDFVPDGASSSKCPICWESFDDESHRMITPSCGHHICLDCLKCDVNARREDDTVAAIICTTSGCSKDPLQIHEAVLGDAELDLQLQINERYVLDLAQRHKLRIKKCPSAFCPFRFYAVDTGEEANVYREQICVMHETPLSFCANCLQIGFHKTDEHGSCCPLEHDANSEQEADLLLTQGFAFCPNESCKAICMRISGCHNVTCTRCKKHFQINDLMQ